MAFSPHDVEILRTLARQTTEIGNLPVQKEKADLWRRLNRLEKVRALVWINEIPWHEMGPEMELQCQDEFCRAEEWNLRAQLYQWNHLRGDMVIDPVLYSGYACSPTSSYGDWGIQENAVRPEGPGSCQFIPVIRDERDVERMRTPPVTMDWEATEQAYQKRCELYDGVIPVQKRGIAHQWCAPWDQVIHWYGIDQLFVDMIDRPQLVHRIMERFMAGIHAILDQQEQAGLLAVSNGNHRVGSGGLGITDQLPGPGFTPAHVRPINQWGSSTGQIFSEVSPDMHEEFCLQYERPYLARFGLNCYGCCEPLHNKLALMRTIPHLRRISMSTWIDVDKAATGMGADYIFSYKPNPALLAMDRWEPALVRANLRSVLEKTRGCRVELILKDITTVRGEYRRLWEWADVALQVAEEMG